MNKPGPAPTKRISTSWSNEVAYAVGLITADGCLYNDGRHINFTSKDEDLIFTFKECLGLKNKVGRKGSGSTKGKRYFYVQFGDVHFYRWLLGVGLLPRKSKVLKSLKVPKRIFFDFLRGLFDGDGTIYGFWDKRWKSSFIYYIRFTSASIDNLKWLQENIYEYSGIVGKIMAGTRAWNLMYAKKATKSLLSKMYYSESVPCLKRKFLKARMLLKIDNFHNDYAQVVESVYTGA